MTPSEATPMKANPRLIIGTHEASPFMGCSDGDIFATPDGKRWQLFGSCGGWTIRPEGKRLDPPLQGFEQIDGWLDLCQRINRAALNGLPQ